MKRGEAIAAVETAIQELQAVLFALKVGKDSGQEVGQDSGLTTPIKVESSSYEEVSKEEEESKKELYRACLPTCGETSPTPFSPTTILSKRGPRGTRLPTEWEVGPTFLEYARRKGLSEPDARHEAEKFKAYWLGVSGKQAVKVDWLQVWQVWILNALGKYGIKPSGPSGGQEVTLSDERRAELAAKFGKRAE